MLRQKNVSNDFQMYFQKMLNVMYSKKCDKVLLSISHTCTMFCCHKVVMWILLQWPLGIFLLHVSWFYNYTLLSAGPQVTIYTHTCRCWLCRYEPNAVCGQNSPTKYPKVYWLLAVVQGTVHVLVLWNVNTWETAYLAPMWPNFTILSTSTWTVPSTTARSH